ncbi:unnamed protein product [Tetraodon nigroviridis]|uniref:(spotted green pufferfish) hypothetical protein n=1 Tax=Tetraodon nigroviridis TaxID=99883 RepID=Q4RJ86_TETNG|nr:unnamed protein product [Tetraodon nigroviridis]
MPVRQKDAQRALELLQQYRAKLHHRHQNQGGVTEGLGEDDQQLNQSLDRVIDVFQSQLFSALLAAPDKPPPTSPGLVKTPETPKASTNHASNKDPGNGIFTESTSPKSPSQGKFPFSHIPTGPAGPVNKELHLRGSHQSGQSRDVSHARWVHNPATRGGAAVSQIQHVHGYVAHSHITPAQVESPEVPSDDEAWPYQEGERLNEVPVPPFSSLYSQQYAYYQLPLCSALGGYGWSTLPTNLVTRGSKGKIPNLQDGLKKAPSKSKAKGKAESKPWPNDTYIWTSCSAETPQHVPHMHHFPQIQAHVQVGWWSIQSP